MTSKSASDVRSSPLAGHWYPADPGELRQMIDGYLSRTTLHPDHNETRGLLVPHAGYRFSGPIVAHAFAQIRGSTFNTVVILGPLHRPIYGVRDPILTTAHSAYRTPFGDVKVNHDLITAISRDVPLCPVRDDVEHSIEIELPFLQHVLNPDFTLVPIMLADQSQVSKLAAVLKKAITDRVLVVASSDLSHFYTQPVAHELDKTMLDSVTALDAERVIRNNREGTGFACGYGAIATVIEALQPVKATITAYGTSGDVTGDLNSVVGYGSGIFTGVKPL